MALQASHTFEASPDALVQVETGVRAVLGFDGGIAVLAAGGRLAGLRERDLATRLDLLFAKGLHGVALNVAEAAQVLPVVRRLSLIKAEAMQAHPVVPGLA
jgi:hypothetical protein